MGLSPQFSIVIPTYNRADFIAKTIDSILNQSYENFEIIVVDDGSTDNTEEVVTALEDARLSYFKKTNGERGAARNYGAKKSRGQYINFFDSDDLAYDNHLSEAVRMIEINQNPEIFHLGYDVKSPDSDLIRHVNNLPEEINDQLITGNHLSCNGVFVRKDIALQYPFNEDRELSASEDYELWLRLASRFRIPISNEITSTIIDHDSRSVVQINLERLLSRINLLKNYLFRDQHFRLKYERELRTFSAYLDIYVALHLAMTKAHRLRTLKYLIGSVSKKPSLAVSRRFAAVIKNLL